MGGVHSSERRSDVSFTEQIPSLSTNRGGYIVTQILSLAHIKSSSYPDMGSYFRDARPEMPRRRCLCADVEARQRSAVRNRLFLVKRIRELDMEGLEGLLAEAFIEYDVNPALKGKKGIMAHIQFSAKDSERLIDFGILASNKVSNNLKIYLAEKARCEGRPGCDLTTLNALQKDCHASLDQLEDVDGKFMKFCDVVGFFGKFCEPVDDKPIEETSHWTPIFARFWGTLVIFLTRLLPGFALCRIKSFTTFDFEDGFYAQEDMKKQRLDLVGKWEKYREFLGSISTDLKESRELVLRLAAKYLMKNFRGEDAKRPHCILDQFILLVDQLKIMRNYFLDVLEMVDGCLLYAHSCLGSLWYNPIFELHYTMMAPFFPHCMPNFYTTILSLYGGYISHLDLGSGECLFCRKECSGLLRYACQECLGESLYGTYCSRECRMADEADHAKICSLRPEETLRKYKSLFAPMKPHTVLRKINCREEENKKATLLPVVDKPSPVDEKAPVIVVEEPKPMKATGGYLQRKTQRMQERMAKRKDRRQATPTSHQEKPSDPCEEVERRHLKILQQRPDLR